MQRSDVRRRASVEVPLRQVVQHPISSLLLHGLPTSTCAYDKAMCETRRLVPLRCMHVDDDAVRTDLCMHCLVFVGDVPRDGLSTVNVSLHGQRRQRRQLTSVRSHIALRPQLL